MYLCIVSRISMPKTSNVDRKVKSKRKTIKNDPCAICHERIRKKHLTKIGCTHYFCYDCIKEWSKRENSCPLCKRKFHRMVRMSTKVVEDVADVSQTAPRDIDNTYGHYSFVLSAFFTSNLFRSRIELGILNGQRAPIVIFLILKDILEQLQGRQLLPHVESLEEYNTAYEWLDRVDTLIGSIRLHSIQLVHQ